jgi:LytS/YehU family sensor histidine kinase
VHAFKGKNERNSIVVRVYAENGRLYLSVADNGIGIASEVAKALLRPIPVDEAEIKVMGLENVIQRLYFFFPDDPSVVTIHSEPGEGTKIIISIDTGKEICIQC